MLHPVEEIFRLYAASGASLYGGEPVSQLEHALQCAQLAAAAGSADALVAASLLHDIGHLVEGDAVDHEGVAADYLSRDFPAAVVEPVRLHVDAKRYLCATRPGYWDALSPASKRSLEFQGGPYDAPEATAFIGRPYARDAVKLRLWDDLAKVPGAAAPGLGHYAGLLRSLAVTA
jgi:phosphonate degradation associated HDIG domain protein